MKRSVFSQEVGERSVRYRTRLEGAVAEYGTLESEASRDYMLRAIVDNPALLFCGPSRFYTMRMFHDGTRWLIETEATVDKA